MNIAEILRGVPKGTKLYCPIYGNVVLYEINSKNQIVIITPDSILVNLNEEGKWTKNGELMIFPSKENRDWSEFKVEDYNHKYFKPFQKVLVHTLFKFWVAAIYSNYDGKYHITTTMCQIKDEDIIPYEGNEDKLGKEVKI